MKFLVLSGTQFPSNTANSIQIMKMSEALIENGHNVMVTTRVPAPSGDNSTKLIASHYGLNVDIEVARVPRIPTPIGIIVFVLWAVLAHVRKFGLPNVVMTREPNIASLAALLRIETVLELHQIPSTKLAGRSLRRLVNKNNVSLIGISEAVRSDVSQLVGIAPEKLDMTILRSGVDLSLFELSGQQSENTDRKAVTYAGSMYPGKGADEVVEIASRIPAADFILVGGSPSDLERIRARIKILNLSNVTLEGHVPHREIPYFLSKSDILLLPLQPNSQASGGGDIGRWTSPMKLFEYMAAGRPICASDLPVVREIVNDDQVMFVAPNDIDSWVTTIQTLIDDPEMRASLRINARRAVEPFSWKNRAKKLEVMLIEADSRD